MIYRLMSLLVVGLLLTSLEACSDSKGKVAIDAPLKTQLDSVAYGIGMNIGKQLKNDSVMVDINAFASGLYDALYTDTTKMTEKQLSEVMMAFQTQLQAKAQEKAMKESGVNMEKGKKFLDENKKKPGVKTTQSGLQYEVLKEGTGATPKATDKVKVHYHGTLLDGKVFDSSVQRGEPVEFPLGQVIKGWTEGLQLMKVGAKYRFWVPSDLGYGDRGAPPQIGPGELLVFEVELLGISAPDANKSDDANSPK
jgi:FKBP-type peptidyl-prolyl cis-trans isomerase